MHNSDIVAVPTLPEQVQCQVGINLTDRRHQRSRHSLAPHLRRFNCQFPFEVFALGKARKPDAQLSAGNRLFFKRNLLGLLVNHFV